MANPADAKGVEAEAFRSIAQKLLKAPVNKSSGIRFFLDAMEKES
jgi:hypothetical protein